MRRIEILNKNYQKFILNMPIDELNNKTLTDVFENQYNNYQEFTETVNIPTSNTYSIYNHTVVNFQNNHKIYIFFKRSVLASNALASEVRHFIYDIATSLSNTNRTGSIIFGSIIKTVQDISLSKTHTFRILNSGTEQNVTFTHYMSGIINLNLLGIEELSLQRLDYWLNVYMFFKFQIKNPNIQYPLYIIPTDPTGLGNKYSLQELNKVVYGHELDFDNIQLNLVFGIYKNSYQSFNLLMNFLIDNECILEYDYGSGIRYVDTRIINAPKTEMEAGKIIRSKFDFKRLTPFYTLLQGSSVLVTNTHDWKLKPIVEGTVNTNTVWIEAENLETSVNQSVKFDFTSVSKPFNFYYNSETKQILINGVNIGYKYIDLTAGKTFIEVPKGDQHSIYTTGVTNPVVKVKKWVID